MMKYILAALLLTSSALPAFAQNDLALCKLRAQHMASPGAAYQPGVDVYGKPVMPADVNAAPSMVPDVIRIPMTVDLAQRLGTVPTGAELKSETGMVEIHKDGKVTFNGQDMTSQSVVVCGDQAPVQAVTQQMPAAAPAVPATGQPTRIVVPQDAPAMPMATVPVKPSTPAAVVAPAVPANAVASPPLPPQTLGQFTIPAKQPVAPVAAPVAAPAPAVQPPAAAPAPAAMGERTNADLAKDDEIIWGQGN